MPINLPPYSVFPQLANNAVLLRQVNGQDIPDLVEISFYNGVPASSIEDAWMMQQRVDHDYTNGNSVHWVILNKSSGTIVGTCGYYRGFDQLIGELGFVLKSAHRGRGYMTEALKRVIDFGIHKINLVEIKAIISVDNQQAVALLKRLNFEPNSDVDGMTTFLYILK